MRSSRLTVKQGTEPSFKKDIWAALPARSSTRHLRRIFRSSSRVDRVSAYSLLRARRLAAIGKLLSKTRSNLSSLWPLRFREQRLRFQVGSGVVVVHQLHRRFRPRVVTRVALASRAPSSTAAAGAPPHATRKTVWPRLPGGLFALSQLLADRSIFLLEFLVQLLQATDLIVGELQLGAMFQDGRNGRARERRKLGG